QFTSTLRFSCSLVSSVPDDMLAPLPPLIPCACPSGQGSQIVAALCLRAAPSYDSLRDDLAARSPRVRTHRGCRPDLPGPGTGRDSQGPGGQRVTTCCRGPGAVLVPDRRGDLAGAV